MYRLSHVEQNNSQRTFSDSSRETELHTDASAKGFGAILLQKQKDGKFHPVAYFSECTTKVETKYHSSELQDIGNCLCIETI